MSAPQVKHVELYPSQLHAMGKEAGLQPGVNLIDWYLNTQAPGRLIAVTAIPQPVPGSHLSPQGPRVEPVFHCFFEVASVMTLARQLEDAKAGGVEVVVLIYGKPGCGKTKLAEAFLDTLGGGRRVRAYTTNNKREFSFAEADVQTGNWNKEGDQ